MLPAEEVFKIVKSSKQYNQFCHMLSLCMLQKYYLAWKGNVRKGPGLGLSPKIQTKQLTSQEAS